MSEQQTCPKCGLRGNVTYNAQNSFIRSAEVSENYQCSTCGWFNVTAKIVKSSIKYEFEEEIK